MKTGAATKIGGRELAVTPSMPQVSALTGGFGSDGVGTRRYPTPAPRVVREVKQPPPLQDPGTEADEAGSHGSITAGTSVSNTSPSASAPERGAQVAQSLHATTSIV